jgi:hypothetical protein
MSQNQATGAAANQWGRQMAQKIIIAYGGKSASSTSNEFFKDEELLVMKCAAPATTSVGVSYKMLDRIHGVVAAFADTPSKFSIYRMSSEKYKSLMRPTASRGASSGKVGVVTKSEFAEHGVQEGHLSL